ncbi:MAG: hypothetical protein CBD97_00255 [Pelagibacteraceae bacterium TMED237]|nr:MAG: hypothetical protein CBD97_00255 [Pelagibacteraceae bacterium TMED237]|tara:strand:- start:6613 stop:7443 length:831 start_codon:yes stop_codon:yes gene_type:complete
MLLFLAQGMARRYSQRKDEQIAIDNKIKLEKRLTEIRENAAARRAAVAEASAKRKEKALLLKRVMPLVNGDADMAASLMDRYDAEQLLYYTGQAANMAHTGASFIKEGDINPILKTPDPETMENNYRIMLNQGNPEQKTQALNWFETQKDLESLGDSSGMNLKEIKDVQAIMATQLSNAIATNNGIPQQVKTISANGMTTASGKEYVEFMSNQGLKVLNDSLDAAKVFDPKLRRRLLAGYQYFGELNITETGGTKYTTPVPTGTNLPPNVGVIEIK